MSWPISLSSMPVRHCHNLDSGCRRTCSDRVIVDIAKLWLLSSHTFCPQWTSVKIHQVGAEGESEDLELTWCFAHGIFRLWNFLGPFWKKSSNLSGLLNFLLRGWHWLWISGVVKKIWPGWIINSFKIQIAATVEVPIPSIYVLKASCDRNCAIVLGKATKHVHRNNMKQLKHLKCLVNAIAHTIHVRYMYPHLADFYGR